MPTAIKQTAKQLNPLTSLMADARKLYLSAEFIIRDLAESDKSTKTYSIDISPESAAILRIAGYDPDTPEAMRREFARVSAERELAELSGTPSEFAEAQAKAAKLSEELRIKTKELGPRIAEMQRELAQLEAAERAAVGKAEAMATARKNLRDMLPKFVKGIIDRQRGRGASPDEVESLVRDLIDKASGSPDWIGELDF